MSSGPGVGIGQIIINSKPYNIAPMQKAYDVQEVPAHADVDQKMERRVIYRDFSSGISPQKEEVSMDATAFSSPSFTYIRQNRISNGVYWAGGVDTRVRNRVFTQRATTASNFSSTTEVPKLFGDASTYSYMLTTQTVQALTTPPSTWTLSKNFATNTTDAIQYGGQLYVAVGSALGFWTWDQTSATTNWTERTPTASYFAVIRNQLWRASGASVYDTVNTDPSNQVWSGATVIGDPNTNITGLDVFQDFLLIFKQDGIYSMDRGGNVYPVFPGFRNLGMNPRPLGQWRDLYYFASDVGMIWEWGVSKGVSRIGFDYSEPYPMNPNDTTIFSIPNAVGRGIALPNYFIVPFEQYNPTSNSNAYFLAWDGTGWHPFEYYSAYSTKAIGVTGGNTNPVNPVLQFGIEERSNSTNQVYYMSNPLIDPFLAASFDTNPHTMYLPVDNGSLEDEYKVLEHISVWLDNATAGTLRVAYATDDNIATLNFTDMGPPSNDKSFGFQVFQASQPFPSYHKIQLRLTLTATASTASPQLKYLILHYKQRVPQRRVWKITLLAEQNLIGANGRLDSRTTKEIIADLNTARDTHQQVTLNDPFGEATPVYIDEVNATIEILKGFQSPSALVTVTMVEVMTSDEVT